MLCLMLCTKGKKMKATIEFNLPEEQEEFEDATNGWKWGHAMWQLDQFLRTKVKYAPDDASEESIYEITIGGRIQKLIHEKISYCKRLF